MNIPAALRLQVSRRAARRCEYCGLSQAGQEAAFHVDHITPVVSGGATTDGNPALACVSCSLRKGARRTAVDPRTGQMVALFHPRLQNWNEHFAWRGSRVSGPAGIGRATIAARRLNRILILAIRAEETARGRHPPP